MNINKRLKLIGDLVPKDSLCLDIGCDHALLDIYLVKEKGFKKVIASDKLEDPLKSAEENIKKYKVEKNIELRLGSGLDVYTTDINTIVISGVGGLNIIGMFKYNPEKLKTINTIILSPNSYQEDVKKFFIKNKYYIDDEYLVKEGKHIYQVIVLKKGKKKYSNKEIYFGPILLTKKDQLFKEYYELELKRLEFLSKSLPKRYWYKKYITNKKIKILKEEL